MKVKASDFHIIKLADYGMGLCKWRFWIEDHSTGKRKRKQFTIKTTEATIVKIKARKLADIDENRFLGRPKGSIPFSEIANDFLEYSKARKRSYKQDAYQVRALIEYFGDKPADRITPNDIEKYRTMRLQVDTRRKKKLSEASVNREISLLRTIFNRAIAAEKIDKNPARPSLVKLAKERPRDAEWTDEQVLSAIRAAPEYGAVAILFARFTGMRRGEILSLQGKDRKGRFIRLDAEKTKAKYSRKVPIPKPLLKFWPFNKEDYLISRNGQPLKILRSFNDWLENAGIKGVCFHDLRRSYISASHRAGIPERVVAMIAGHNPKDVHSRYVNINDADLLNAADKLASGNFLQTCVEAMREKADIKRFL